MNIKEALLPFEGQPLTKQIIFGLLKDYLRPHDKISELVKEGLLLPVKRGIYIPGKKSNIKPPEPLLLANHLWGPSYVSMETALAYWGLIPERVYEISSVTTKPSKVFDTVAGRFSYYHIGLPYFAYSFRQVVIATNQHALIASPEKALCDKIISTSGILLRSKKQVMDLLIRDLRMEESALQTMDISLLETLVKNAPKKNSLSMLIKTLQSI